MKRRSVAVYPTPASGYGKRSGFVASGSTQVRIAASHTAYPQFTSRYLSVGSRVWRRVFVVARPSVRSKGQGSAPPGAW